MELVFSINNTIRKVLIKGRVVTFLTAETGYEPIEIDLNKLEQKEYQEKLRDMKADIKLINSLKKLKTEREIKEDIIKDFKKSGWILMNKT